MEPVDRDLKCNFCRAGMVFLIRDQAYLRDLGFKHDLRYCDGCKSRPEWNLTSSSDRSQAN